MTDDTKEKKPRGPRKTFAEKLADARKVADVSVRKTLRRLNDAKSRQMQADLAHETAVLELEQIDAMIAAGNGKL